jgi:hypothetical protein
VPEVVGFFVGATAVALVQLVRLRDLRILPLLAMFAMLAVAHSRPDGWAARPWHYAAGAAGLVLLLMLSPRHPHPRA